MLVDAITPPNTPVQEDGLNVEEGVVKATGHGRLPAELMDAVLDHLNLDAASSDDMAMFVRLRQVNAATKARVEERAPLCCDRHTSQVWKGLVDVHGVKGVDVLPEMGDRPSLAAARYLVFRLDGSARVQRIQQLRAVTCIVSLFAGSLRSLALDMSSENTVLAPLLVGLAGCTVLEKLKVEHLASWENFSRLPLHGLATLRKLVIHSSCNQLVSLPYRWSPALEALSVEGFQLLFDLSTCTSLRILRVNNAGTWIEHLGLSVSEITRLDAKGLSDAALVALNLAHNHRLTTLSFEDSAITNPLALALDANQSVTSLSLRFARKLATLDFALERNNTLSFLDLSHLRLFDRDGMGWAGEEYRRLGDQLAANRTLRVLKLNSVGMKDKHLVLLRMGENTGVEQLDLVDNKITNRGVQRMGLLENAAGRSAWERGRGGRRPKQVLDRRQASPGHLVAFW